MFKYSKIQCSYLFCYLLDVYIYIYRLHPSHPRHLTEFRSTRKCTVPHLTFLALQLPFFFLIFQRAFHCHCVMNETTFSNSLSTNRRLSTESISARMQAFGRDRAWRWCTKRRKFLSSLPWIPILSLFYPYCQQSRIFEECSKNVNLMSRITR
jgi:hypothetical protein